MSKTLIGALALAFFSAQGLAASPSLYKWRDAQGVLHFSQTPPSTNAREMDVPKTPKLGNAAAQSAVEDLAKHQAAAAEAKKQARQREAQAHTKQIARKKTCERARQRLQALKTHPGPTLLRRGPDGSVQRMTQAEHDQLEVQTRNQIASECDSGTAAR